MTTFIKTIDLKSNVENAVIVSSVYNGVLILKIFERYEGYFPNFRYNVDN